LGDHDQPPRTNLHDGARRIGSGAAPTPAHEGWSIAYELNRTEADLAYRWLSQESYWASGLPRPVFDRAMANSLTVALKDPHGALRGIGRFITDRATFAYLCDVYLDPGCRGRGVGQWMMDQALAHPDLKDLRRIVLVTRDAHGFYAKFGFTSLTQPENFMHRHDPGIYRRLSQGT